MEDIEIWKSKVNECVAVQQEMHNEWDTAINLYNCQYQDPYSPVDMERVDVNFVNWYVTNLVSLCYFRDPYIFFKTETDSWERFSETLEKVVNKEWKRLDLKSQFKDVILSGLLTSPGWLKEGYTAKIGQDEAKHEENKEKEEAKSLITSIKEVITGVVKKEKEVELPEEKGILNHNIQEESIFVTWIPSWNILIPPGYHRFKDIPYMIQKEKVAMRDFIDNPEYKNKDNIATVYMARQDMPGKRLQTVPYDTSAVPVDNRSELSTIDLYHIWDRRSQKRMTLSLLGDEWHRT